MGCACVPAASILGAALYGPLRCFLDVVSRALLVELVQPSFRLVFANYWDLEWCDGGTIVVQHKPSHTGIPAHNCIVLLIAISKSNSNGA